MYMYYPQSFLYLTTVSHRQSRLPVQALCVVLGDTEKREMLPISSPSLDTAVPQAGSGLAGPSCDKTIAPKRVALPSLTDAPWNDGGGHTQSGVFSKAHGEHKPNATHWQGQRLE